MRLSSCVLLSHNLSVVFVKFKCIPFTAILNVSVPINQKKLLFIECAWELYVLRIL